MFTMHVTVDVKDDRQVVLTMPPEVPLGTIDLVVSVASLTGEVKKPRTSLAEWAEAGAENWGTSIRSEDVESFTGRRF